MRSQRWYLYLFWHTIMLGLVITWMIYHCECFGVQKPLKQRTFQAEVVLVSLTISFQLSCVLLNVFHIFVMAWSCISSPFSFSFLSRELDLRCVYRILLSVRSNILLSTGVLGQLQPTVCPMPGSLFINSS